MKIRLILALTAITLFALPAADAFAAPTLSFEPAFSSGAHLGERPRSLPNSKSPERNTADTQIP
jgi:hypothetical protein